MISRAQLLAVVGNVDRLQVHTINHDESFLLDAGIVPYELLKRALVSLFPEHFSLVWRSDEYESLLDWFDHHEDSPYVQLQGYPSPTPLNPDRWKDRKIIVSEGGQYLKLNPRDRTNLMVTRHNIQKPVIRSHGTYKAGYSVKGRDRLFLWYAVANGAKTGSRGEAKGLELIIKFMRLPRIQKIWRRWQRENDRPQFPLPEDAK